MAEPEDSSSFTKSADYSSLVTDEETKLPTPLEKEEKIVTGESDNEPSRFNETNQGQCPPSNTHEKEVYGIPQSFKQGEDNESNQESSSSDPNILLPENIKLNETENPWKPMHLKSSDDVSPEMQDNDEFIRKIRGVLNKLTLENLDILCDEIMELKVYTLGLDKMNGFVMFIFEKAINEPNLTTTYVHLCQRLAQKNIQCKDESFKGALIDNTEREFHNNVIDLQAKDTKLKPIIEQLNKCTDPPKKQELKAVLEEQDHMLRRRYCGIARFIGELFNISILTSNIIKICIYMLLDPISEKKLECICTLLRTIGKKFETIFIGNELGSTCLDDVISKMQNIVDKGTEEGKISNRVRFMLQDVIDLRTAEWVAIRLEQEVEVLDEASSEQQSSCNGGDNLDEKCEFPIDDDSWWSSSTQSYDGSDEMCLNQTPRSCVADTSELKEPFKANRSTFKFSRNQVRSINGGNKSRSAIVVESKKAYLPKPKEYHSSESGRRFSENLRPRENMKGKDYHPYHAKKNEKRMGPQNYLNSLSLRENINFKAWKPYFELSNYVSPETREMEQIFQRIHGTVTPEKLDTILLNEIMKLKINTPDKINALVVLIFEMAIFEPNFTESYARLYKRLAKKNLQCKIQSFKGAFIDKIENEFKDILKDWEDKNTKVNPTMEQLNKCTDPRKKQVLKAILEDQEYLLRRRQCGIIRFIGEIFRMSMLTGNIIKNCIYKLLDPISEEKLEYLCQLLTTVGKEFEGATVLTQRRVSKGSNSLDHVMRKLQNIVDGRIEGAISNRICSTIQDVIDLRKTKWVARRSDQRFEVLEQASSNQQRWGSRGYNSSNKYNQQHESGSSYMNSYDSKCGSFHKKRNLQSTDEILFNQATNANRSKRTYWPKRQKYQSSKAAEKAVSGNSTKNTEFKQGPKPEDISRRRSSGYYRKAYYHKKKKENRTREPEKQLAASFARSTELTSPVIYGESILKPLEKYVNPVCPPKPEGKILSRNNTESSRSNENTCQSIDTTTSKDNTKTSVESEKTQSNIGESTVKSSTFVINYKDEQSSPSNAHEKKDFDIQRSFDQGKHYKSNQESSNSDTNLSPENIRLAEAENSRKPVYSESSDDVSAELRQMLELYCTRNNQTGMLNTLLKEIMKLKINTPDKITGLAMLIFEMAINAPKNSVLCACLSLEIMDDKVFQSEVEESKVKASNLVFKVALIDKTEQEFHDNVIDLQGKAAELKPTIEQLNQCTDARKKQELQEILEEQQYLLWRRSFGIVRFIGELFVRSILTENFIMGCLYKLLDPVSDKKLECLCELWATVVEKVDRNCLDDVIVKLQNILYKGTEESKISNLVSIMLQDVIDIQKNDWMPPDHFRCDILKVHAVLTIMVETVMVESVDACIEVWMEIPKKLHWVLVYIIFKHFVHFSITETTPRKTLSDIIVLLLEKNHLQLDDFKKGYNEFCKIAENDIVIDVPDAWKNIFEFIGGIIYKKQFSIKFMLNHKLIDDTTTARKLFENFILYFTKEIGPKYTKSLWKDSYVEWEDFLSESDKTKFKRGKKFLFLNDRDTEWWRSEPDIDKIVEYARKFLKNPDMSDFAIDYLRGNIESITTASVRALTITLCEFASYYENDSYSLDQVIFVNKCVPLLCRYIDSKEDRELECLSAMLEYVSELSDPPNLLPSLFSELYNADIISEDSFIKWWHSRRESAEMTPLIVELRRFFSLLCDEGNDEN